MLKYAGMLKPGILRQPKWNASCDIDLEWRQWKRSETMYRYVDISTGKVLATDAPLLQKSFFSFSQRVDKSQLAVESAIVCG